MNGHHCCAKYDRPQPKENQDGCSTLDVDCLAGLSGGGNHGDGGFALWTRWMCTGWLPGLVAPGHLHGRFFAFWVVTLMGGAMTVMLGAPSAISMEALFEPLPE
jgi:hypothetical protein